MVRLELFFPLLRAQHYVGTLSAPRLLQLKLAGSADVNPPCYRRSCGGFCNIVAQSVLAAPSAGRAVCRAPLPAGGSTGGLRACGGDGSRWVLMDAHGEKRKEQQLISISSISAGIRQGLSRDGVKANLPLPGKGVLRAAALLSCLSVHLRAASGNLTARSHTFLTVCLFVDGGGLQVKGFGGEKRTLFPSSCPTDRKEPGKAERSSWDQERALRGRLWPGRHPGPGGVR